MAKIIGTIKGGTTVPVDSRVIKVTSIEERNAILNKFEGLEVYVNSDKYAYINGAWVYKGSNAPTLPTQLKSMSTGQSLILSHVSIDTGDTYILRGLTAGTNITITTGENGDIIINSTASGSGDTTQYQKLVNISTITDGNASFSTQAKTSNLNRGRTTGVLTSNIPIGGVNYVCNITEDASYYYAVILTYGSNKYISIKNDSISKTDSTATTSGWRNFRVTDENVKVITATTGTLSIDWSSADRFIINASSLTGTMTLSFTNKSIGTRIVSLYRPSGLAVGLSDTWQVNGTIVDGYNVLTFNYMNPSLNSIVWKELNIAPYATKTTLT